MYVPDEKLFVFRLRRTARGIMPEGLSLRYTAITLIGLATESESTVVRILAGDSFLDVCDRLAGEVRQINNLGELALILWAAQAVGYRDCRLLWRRLLEFKPVEFSYPTVEVAWTLAAL